MLLCGIFILIAGVFRDIPENVTESVEHVLDRDVELTDRENGLYTYQTAVSVPIEGTISFQARDDEGIRTNYAQQAFRYIADAYFQELFDNGAIVVTAFGYADPPTRYFTFKRTPEFGYNIAVNKWLAGEK